MGQRTRRRVFEVGSVAAVAVTAAVLAATSSGAGPKPIRTCSTAALKSAVAAGGSWVFQCSGTIIAPQPENPPRIELGKGFEVRKSLTLDVAQGKNVTLQAGQASLPDNSTEGWRIFTVFPGVTLTLRDLMLSGNAPAPDGDSNTTDTSGAPGADGGPGVSGEKGVDGGLGSPGGAGAIAQGGAIYNQGTVNLASDQFDGVNVQGGKGGNGSTGGNGGDGGSGGQADPGAQATCQQPNDGPSVYYTQQGDPGGGGGNGGETGVGMAGGFGGLAQGGAIYNQGKLNVSDTTFQGDSAQGGVGGDGGKGGDGGGGGDGADGYGAGDGGDGGHGADGAPAGPGGGGMGGAIFNVGTAALFNTQFSSDSVQGGNSGNGGDGGKGGDGGSGGNGISYESCDGGFVHEHTTPDGSGGNGGGGSNGGKGAAGGTALGGAIYNEGHLALFDSSFKQDTLTMGLGAQPVASCGGNQSVPCVGKGAQGGKGGDSGTEGDPPGLTGASGTDGKIGVNGPAFGKDVYGQKPVSVTTDGKATGGRIFSAPQGAAVPVKCKGKPSQACVLQYDIALPGPLGHAAPLGSGQLILLGGQATVWQLTLGEVGLVILQHLHHTHLHVTVVQVNGHHRTTVASGDVSG